MHNAVVASFFVVVYILYLVVRFLNAMQAEYRSMCLLSSSAPMNLDFLNSRHFSLDVIIFLCCQSQNYLRC